MLKLQAIKPKVKQAIDIDKLRRAIKRATDDSAHEVLKDFQATTKTWETDVTFTVKTDGPNREIGTTNQVYKWVDEGTPPHDIYPKNKKLLRFGLNPVAKTVPGNILSRAGRPGSPMVFARKVRHPGTKARKFTETIRKRRQALLAKKIQDAVREATG